MIKIPGLSKLRKWKIPIPRSVQAKLNYLPLPATYFFLACTSLFLTCILLILSLLDFGIFSHYIHPPIAIYTIIYHILVFVLCIHRPTRGDQENEPSYFWTCTICADILGLLWLIGFFATVSNKPYAGEYTNIAGTRGTQVMQGFLSFVEMAVIGTVGIKGHLEMRTNDCPLGWRPIRGKDQNV